jgi:hypothetical protein
LVFAIPFLTRGWELFVLLAQYPLSRSGTFDGAFDGATGRVEQLTDDEK